RVSVLPDRDWQAKWKRGLRPLRISGDLVIQPSWCRVKQSAIPGMTVLKIDPKTAFGTGHHSTT
ncbi:MAG: 50S ribosomal protein L11 methyltransferase, partial [Armatimonadetes bacterium]|nr:50S ribosomal protein L11 methyltransferase [Armatimonadota bacterium]NIM24759.1 50S ribosomal protein L11 methyltransferase [Armatimonadota bacterium]NIM68645.1 50S ribosomal protein L11 methyltransferase [Armatimonadota bacterium]NIO98621.1 50S ribosomal protein L11 methyltransferase [Armatimonadota bacterium]NIT32143.1 50S ribosomal protein L11 methyltransferase [Armatimonadota bacterium]